MKKMTPHELIAEMQSDSLLNQIRQKFSYGFANIEQACQQRTIPSALELRQMEFDIAQEIMDLMKNANSRN